MIKIKSSNILILIVIQILIKITTESPEGEDKKKLNELWDLSTTSQFRVVAQLSLTYATAYNISRKEFLTNEPKLYMQLQHNFPTCDRTIFVAFLADLENIITSTEPYLCDAEIESISINADKIFVQGIHLQSWFQQLDICIKTRKCNFEKKYRQIHGKVLRMVDAINDIEDNVKTTKWNVTQRCYNYLMQQMIEKMSKSSLTEQECQSIKNYKTFLHKLSLLPLKIDSFLGKHVEDLNSNPLPQMNEEKTKDIWDRYEKINIETFDYQTFLFAKILNITHKVHKNLQPHLILLVQDKIPSCYNDFTIQLVSDLDHILLETQPSPCHRFIEHFQHTTEKILKEGIGLVEPTLASMPYCTTSKDTCDFDEQYKVTLGNITKLERQLSDLKTNVTFHNWDDITNCYNDLALRIESKISQLSPTSETCETITDYDGFLKECGLFPLDIDLFTNKKPVEINYTCSEPVEDVSKKNSSQIKVRENRMIRDQLSNLTMGIRYFLDHLQMKITPILNTSLSHVLTALHGMMEEELTPSSPIRPKCYNDNAAKLEKDLITWYMTTIYSICWDPIPQVMKNFSLINQHVLPSTGGKLFNDPDCSSSPQNVCSEAMLRINKLYNTLNNWKSFDLSNTMEFAKHCYDAVNSVILMNIREHHTQLNKCQYIPYSEHVFQNLPVNVETYPPCGVQ